MTTAKFLIPATLLWSPIGAWNRAAQNGLLPAIAFFLGGYVSVGILKLSFYNAVANRIPGTNLPDATLFSSGAFYVSAVMFAVAVVAARTVVIATIVWLCVLIAIPDSKFGNALRVVVFCEIIPLLQEWIELLIMHLRGIDSFRDANDLIFLWGLDNFVSPDTVPIFVAALVEQLTFFRAWWIVLLYYGLRELVRTPSRVAGAIPFLLIVGFWALGILY